MSKQFVVGKTYKTVVPNFFPLAGLTKAGQKFTCDYIDNTGYCYSQSVKYPSCFDTPVNGWCVAAPLELEDGLVVEI